MDFFRRQAETRRFSRWLVLLFIVAVALIVAAVDLVVALAVMALSEPEATALAGGPLGFDRYPGTIAVSSLIVLSIIGIASLVRTSQLALGGGSVAQALGGTRLSGDSGDPLRRRLINVVEEMAIASGVPVPEVYVLEHEPGINAFAAGDNPANAAIAVTRGALTTLNRAELQGVVAHEFSHILNGDMRLNTRLIGWLFGLLVLAMIARLILRHAPRGGGGRRGGGAVLVVVMAAGAILVLGYIGLFFGRLIQAAVSRRRESLADASAIQFTRDTAGLRDALVKIGASEAGSRIRDSDAEEIAHLLFAPGVARAFRTHPPLIERIRAIDPRFQPEEFAAMRRRMQEERAPEPAGEAGVAARAPQHSETGALPELLLAPAAVVGLVANPAAPHVLMARDLLQSLPEPLRRMARQPETAPALFLALALDPVADVRARQMAFITQQYGGTMRADLEALLAPVDGLDAAQRLPALQQVFPALQQLGQTERLALLRCVNGLLTREGRTSVFAYVLRKLAQVHLRDEARPRQRTGIALALPAAREEIRLLLSVLALSGSVDEEQARQAWAAGMRELRFDDSDGLARRANWPRELDVALNRLDRLAPAGKEALVRALARTISHDQRLTPGEAELLRAVCATLHCPLPPLAADGMITPRGVSSPRVA
ncbi:MAG: M48 family metallopeptidase [Gammaproteobacteria bacterium]|nr:M48 family metallopeptidase [Gammaproteobacteria bacterium]